MARVSFFKSFPSISAAPKSTKSPATVIGFAGIAAEAIESKLHNRPARQ
jgi:hypothetical protein